MNKNLVLPALCLLALWTAPMAHALQKCIRPDGRVEYTDGVCQMGAAATRPNLVDNSADSSADRAEIMRHRLEEEQRQTAAAARGYGANDHSDRSNSYECRIAIKNYETSQSSITRRTPRDAGPSASVAAACGSAFVQAHTTRPARSRPTSIPTPPPEPSVITSCDPTGCWDDLGGRYNKGAGPTFIGPNGTACTGVGGMMHCP